MLASNIAGRDHAIDNGRQIDRIAKLFSRRSTLRAKITLAAVVTVGSVALYFVHTLLAQQALGVATREILDKRIVTMQAADKIKRTLLRDEIALFHYLATRNKNQLVQGEQLGQKALEEIHNLQRLPRNAETQALLAQLDSEIHRYFTDAQEAI